MSAHKLLSSIIDYKKNPKHYNQMLELSKNPNLHYDQKIDLFYALGKAQEDLGDYEKSFISLEFANKLKRENIEYDIKKEEDLFSSIIETFQKISLNQILKKVI